jgi:demethylmenaquinone methyltransferase/2-methoxy-6-polyprenyl-1,4-benzoquinol methylase
VEIRVWLERAANSVWAGMDALDPDGLLAEQMAYYRAWAPEYDHCARRDETQVDRAELEAALATFDPSGDVLELAGGTGNWTVQVARYADKLTVIDSSSETLAINRAKLAAKAIPVEFAVADLFGWKPQRRYDVVFFSFWLTHVPRGRFDAFWELVRVSLKPEGRVFFIDNAYPGPSTAAGDAHSDLVVVADEPASGVSLRRCSDGRHYKIVKVYWRPDALERRLDLLGWDVHVHETAQRRCIYGHGVPRRY